ncbi:MAG: amidohydrolase, partial [Pirellulaceae bacterium]
MRYISFAFFSIVLSSLTLGQAHGQSNETGGRVADLVIQNVIVRQCNASFDESDAVAIKDGRIVALGEDSAKSWITDSTRVLNGRGGTLTPGFTDSHLHYVGLGQSLQMLDLKDAENWAAIVQQVVEAAAKVPKGTWIEGRGWHQSKWNELPTNAVDGYPNHRRLSELVPDHPVLLTHASGHACFANAAAMKLGGVGAETKDPSGGEILRESSGEPCGVFRENAQGLVRRALARSKQREDRDPQAIKALLKERIELAGAECLKYGITSVHDAGSSFGLASQMAEFAEAGELPVRIFMMIRTGSRELAGRLPTEKKIGVGSGFFTVRSVKV